MKRIKNERWDTRTNVRPIDFAAIAILLGILAQAGCAGSGTPPPALKDPARDTPIDFPLGTATPSEVCGKCHESIYFEHAFGLGADLKWKPIIYKSLDEPLLTLPSNFSDTVTAHHVAGVDPWPIRAREVENRGESCNVCHYPEPFQIPDINTPVISRPIPRTFAQEATGMTCASCHLTPDGRIRGSYDVVAPHQNVVDPSLRTSAMCAYCHSLGPRVIGKQTQTFYEWRDDFYKAGLGKEHCQDCHMPQTTRSLAEGYDVPPRMVGVHLWAGDHSATVIKKGLSLSIKQASNPVLALTPAGTGLEFHVKNIVTGHSIPSGSNRRGIWLQAEVLDGSGFSIATNEWLFAPWYGDRPDDRAFLEEDRLRVDAIAAIQADAQGPHEPPVRAGEERVLTWSPMLERGNYTVRAVLIYDLNRYNDRAFTGDQTEMTRSSISIQVP